MRNKIVMIAIGSFLVLAGVNTSFSAEFPKDPIRMVVPYSAGGSTDILARVFQVPFEKAMGVKVLVDNIPAGTTKVATIEVMKAKPNGYTLILYPEKAWVAYYYSKTFETEVWKTLTPIANISTEPYGFVEVRSDSPYTTWSDLVKAAKENPGRLTCGGPGAGGMMELLMNEITKAAGVTTKYVPFAGAGQSQIALLGGHIDFRVCHPSEAISMIKAGKTRGLAIRTEKRMKFLPDVPTFKELGIGDSLEATKSIWGPPKLPQNIVNIIAKGIEKATEDSNFIKLVEESLLFTVEYKSGPKVFEELKEFDKKYGPMLTESYK